MRSDASAGIRRAIAALTALVLLAVAASASAQTGGPPAPGAPAGSGAPQSAPAVGKARKAKLIRKSGRAIAPPGAPAAVVNAIASGNAIRKRPYVWGGGHASFESRGYDCSGAVSYVLHAAGLLLRQRRQWAALAGDQAPTARLRGEALDGLLSSVSKLTSRFGRRVLRRWGCEIRAAPRAA